MADALSRRGSFIRAASWIFYDFANTIYSFAVVTLVLPPTLKKVFHSDYPVSVIALSSMIFAGLMVPVLGVLTDLRPWAKKLLLISTSVCVASCMLLSLVLGETMTWPSTLKDSLALPDNTWLYLIAVCGLFFIANATYQAGLMLYNSLLVVAAPKKRWGIVSGIGVGVGYAGSLFTVAVFFVFGVDFEPLAIMVASLLFFFSAVPLFLFVPERRISESRQGRPLKLLKPLKELRAAIKRLPKNRKLFLGLLGNFLCVDALNTLILMMSTYVVNTVYAGSGVLDRPVQILMVGLIVSSIAWSFFNGWLSGKIGSIPALLFAGLMLGVAVLSGVLLVPWPTTFMVVVVATGGAGLSGLWISGRKMVAELAPEKDRGAYFGLYGMTNKIGAMSALVFATLTAFLPKLGISEIASYRFALAFLLVPITLGSWLFGKLVLEQRRSR